MRVHGTVIGKFLPPHRGHHNLINFGAEYCDKLHVIIVQNKQYPEMQQISAEQRMAWLQKIHSASDNIQFYILIPPDDFPEIDDLAWARLTVETIGRYPDLHVSYDYDRDKGYAEAMRAGFLVPPGGAPVRATLIRQDPEMYASYLHPIVRKWYEEQPHEIQEVQEAVSKKRRPSPTIARRFRQSS